VPRRGSIPAAQGVCCWRPFDPAHLHLQIRLYGQGQRDLVDGERNAGVLHGDGDVEDSKLQRGAEKLTAGVDRQAIRQTHGTPNVGGDAVAAAKKKFPLVDCWTDLPTKMHVGGVGNEVVVILTGTVSVMVGPRFVNS